MKTNELRIGNYVYAGHGDFPMYVTSIFDNEVYLDFPGNEGDFWEERHEDLKPIPLTEDILLKCGLERKKFGFTSYIVKNGWFKYSFVLTIWDDGRLFYDWIGGNIEVKYLHQLMNLHFSLTGKELEVKL